MALKFKQGVDISNLSGAMAVALQVAAELIASLEGKDCIVTSGRDGVHGGDSLHYIGDAVDIRIKHLRNPRLIADALRVSLPGKFDVVLEVDHIHIESDIDEGRGGQD